MPKNVEELVINYMVTRKNAGDPSVQRAEISLYLKSIGINKDNVIKGIDEVLRRKRLLPLQNGKITLNPRMR